MHDTAQGSSADMTPEKRIALLSYLVDHNKEHAEELHDLAHGLPEQAAALTHEAHDLLAQSNEKLEAALAALKGE